MFTSIYKPNKLIDFIGNQNVIQPFIKWLLEWEYTNSKNKCALVSGLTGTGKSLLVELILKKHDYNGINVSLEDERDKDYMNNTIKPLLKMKKTFNGQNNALIISEIDAGGDYGFMSSLVECIKETKIPIICICDNRYEQSIKPILNYCFDIKLCKPSYQEVYNLLYNVVIKEKIKIKEQDLKNLYEQSNGDIRFILNTLQFGMKKSNKNIQSTNIFNTTANLLSMDESLENKYNTYWLSSDLHLLMIHENYINNTFGVNNPLRKLENMSYSADALSDADLFETKVNMTNWEFLPHVAMSALNAASKCNKKAMVKFPEFLGRISTMNKNKRNKINYELHTFLEDRKVVKQKDTDTKEKGPTQPKEKKPRGRPKKPMVANK